MAPRTTRPVRATRRSAFAPREALALDPRAFGLTFEVEEMPAGVQVRDGVAVVDVSGPLMNSAGWLWDSYDAITDRAAAALAMKPAPKALVLRIDSPGGVVAGCFEAARSLRSMTAGAGVPLVAYVNGQCTSAAYALASAATRIVAPSTAVVGSVGVIDALVDARAQDAMMGLKVELVASGARKTDGNPHAEITDDARRLAKERVDALAGMFFALVAEHRPGLTPDALRALEAGVLLGTDAKKAGLVDEVATFEALLARLASGEEETEMASYDDALATLRQIAENDEDENAENAKKMLAALEEDDSEESEDAPAPEEDEEASARAAGRPTASRVAVLEAQLAALTAERDTLAGDVESDEARAQRETREVEAAVDEAIKAKRILVSARQQWLAVARTAGVAAFQKMVAPLRAVGGGGAQLKSVGEAKPRLTSARAEQASGKKSTLENALRAAGISEDRIQKELAQRASKEN
jgi:signal peptide peptidase SppA